jgi:hypothetical protein
MFFLWKLFLKEKNSIHLLHKTIHDDLSHHVKYDPPFFMNLTSMRLPYVKKFNSFWSKFMYEDKSEQLLELTEIVSLFVERNPKFHGMNEQKVKDILQYYYPDLVIVENRYINNIGCLSWNKKEDLRKFFEIADTERCDFYRQYTESDFKRKVSKQYFTMYQESL